MKKLILILILSTFTVQAQDKEPDAMEFKWGHSSTERVFNTDSFQLNSFLTGFQWGGSYTMDEALENSCPNF